MNDDSDAMKDMNRVHLRVDAMRRVLCFVSPHCRRIVEIYVISL